MSRKAYFFLSIVVLIWGTSFLATKQALEQVGPAELIAARFTLGWGVMWLAGFRWRPEGPKFRREDLPLLLLLTLIEPVAYFFFETWALRLTAPVNVAMVVCMAPLFTSVFAHLFLAERPGRLFYPALIFSILGVGLALMAGGGGAVFRVGLGEGLAFIACMVVSAYVLVARKLTARYSSYRITRFQMGFTSVFFCVWLLLNGAGGASVSRSWVAWTPAAWTPATWGCVLGLGILSSAVAYFFLNYSFNCMPARHIALGCNFIPVVTLLVGAALPGGSLGWLQVGGISMALVGFGVAVRSESVIKVPISATV